MNIEELLEQYRDNDYYNLSKIENITKLCEEIERLNNDIKELLKENGNKEKVIKAQDSIIKEVREYIEKHIKYECDNAFNGMQFYSYHLYDFNKKELLEILDKVGEEL